MAGAAGGMCQPQASATVRVKRMPKMQGFWLRKKGICATMKLVTKKVCDEQNNASDIRKGAGALFAAMEGMGGGEYE